MTGTITLDEKRNAGEARGRPRGRRGQDQVRGHHRPLMSDFAQHLINGLAAGTIYALVALGYTMVYGVLKLINFAHGDVMMVGAFLGYARGASSWGPSAQSRSGECCSSSWRRWRAARLLGFVIERFAYRPLRDKPRLTALITAIGISFTLSYGFQLDFGPLPGRRAAGLPGDHPADRVARSSATGTWSSGTGRSSAWPSRSR